MFNAGDNIIDIGEVPIHIAMIINLDCLSSANLIGKFEISHVGAAERSIDGKETQPCRWDAIEMAIRVSHEFVGLLRRCIETDGMVDIIRRRKRRLLLITIN